VSVHVHAGPGVSSFGREHMQLSLFSMADQSPFLTALSSTRSKHALPPADQGDHA
jgi:hypothetical protein